MKATRYATFTFTPELSEAEMHIIRAALNVAPDAEIAAGVDLPVRANDVLALRQQVVDALKPAQSSPMATDPVHQSTPLSARR